MLGTDCTGSFQPIYHTITNTTAPTILCNECTHFPNH